MSSISPTKNGETTRTELCCQFKSNGQFKSKLIPRAEFLSVHLIFVNKLFYPKMSKITITFKNELDRKSKSELLGFGFGYKFVLY